MNESTSYDTAAISDLLLAAFSPEDLRRLCRDNEPLRPILHHLSPKHSLLEMVDSVIDYCERMLTFDELLAAVAAVRPRRYALFASKHAGVPLAPGAPAMADRTHPHPREDWGEAIDVEAFYGRERELQTLGHWITTERCRIVVILGMGGIGKTYLTAKLARQVRDQFDHVFWRDLRNAPPPADVLEDGIKFLSGQPLIELPADMAGRISLLMNLLRENRCLLVLDNVETILQGKDRAGVCRHGYEGYGRLLEWMGETDHQSCLIVTSREKPAEIVPLEGDSSPVRSWQLAGLGQAEARKLLQDKGLSGPDEAWATLIQRYGGNPLALRQVSGTIQDLFDGSIPAFLEQSGAVFGNIRSLLQEQIGRSSALQQEIMTWLAIEREPISLAELAGDVLQRVLPKQLLEGLDSLQRRSLIERSGARFTLQPVVMEYIIDALVERASGEVISGPLEVLERCALIKAQAKDYIREHQTRLILKPVFDNLLNALGRRGIEDRVRDLLSTMQSEAPLRPSYAAGNLLNLLLQAGISVHGYDFSNLVVWQAYLQGADLQDVNFAHADLGKSMFTETFGSIRSVAFNAGGGILATGSVNGEIHLWNVATGSQLLTLHGHTDWVDSVAFDPLNGRLASGSSDHSVRLWDVNNGWNLKTLREHTGRVRSVAFHPDGGLMASGSDDHTVRLWDVDTGECLATLQGHSDQVWAVGFSSGGDRLASGGHDRTIRIWDTGTGECTRVLEGHGARITAVAFSHDDKLLASGSHDKTARIWDPDDGRLLQTLEGHSNRVWSICFSIDDGLLASGGEDHTIRLWDVQSGECLRILTGHSSRIWSIAASSDGKTLSSGSADQTVRLWDMQTGRCLRVLRGYSNRVWAIACSPDGTTLASGGDDRVIRLWDIETGQRIKALRGHASRVTSIVFGPDGRRLASVSEDQPVRLWDVDTGADLGNLQGHTNWVRSIAFGPRNDVIAGGSEDQTVWLWNADSRLRLKTLEGHTNWVRSVAFHPLGALLASSSDDLTVRIWDVDKGTCLRTLRGHSGWVRSVAFSPDGRSLVSGSGDRTVRLWDADSGECSKVLQGHTSRVRSVAFSPDGRLVASGSEGHRVRVWDAETGACVRVLEDHTDPVRAIAFSHDGRALISCGDDETIRLWDMESYRCTSVLTTAKPYEGMNIASATGLTEAQKATLRALGAVEHTDGP